MTRLIVPISHPVREDRNGISDRGHPRRHRPFKHGKLRWLGKRDTVVVLGDFGFVWDGSKEEQKKLDWLRKRPYTLLFLDGSHENYDLLSSIPPRNALAGRCRPWVAMCTMCAAAACWNWRIKNTCALVVRKARMWRIGNPA